MANETAQFIDCNGRRIAILRGEGRGSDSTGLLWLPGYKSDMASTKATALADFARGRFQMTRFDYSGHGQSDGRFEDGTIGTWLDEAEDVFAQATSGRQIVIGSSMGGYLALLLLRRMLARGGGAADRIAALVLIAPAWDMTEALMWNAFSAAQRAEIEANGFWLRPSQYGEPYMITRALIAEGRQHLMAGQPFDPGRPVHILQGLDDPDVPAAHTRGLLDLLTGGWVRIEEIAHGDHRLSRPQDIARLCEVIDDLADRIAR
jgi:pimeloyl-ACP methyl ester carboxylesterase